ncbi:KISS1R [Mytilus coruscus]|uniref:KISS1R n=1 Tax=Mytilus coruscus TaxID=42192 RepID=A0A6J8E8Q9_MYTCO|nr:KISS1R [Mytilus coruscus]
MIAIALNSTEDDFSTNSTVNLITNRTWLFVKAVLEAFLTIIFNLLLLGLCAIIPAQARNQLHIFYTFLAASDLINDIYLLLLSASFYFVNTSILKYYNVCFSVMVTASAGLLTTGYLLLLLTGIKCFSIVFPLKSLRFITRNGATCLSSAVWSFSYAVYVVPSIVWARKKSFFLKEEECGVKMVYDDKVKQFVSLGYVLSSVFVAGVILFNSFILLKITKRNKVGVQEQSKCNTDIGMRQYEKSVKDISGKNKIQDIKSEKPHLKGKISQKDGNKYDFRKSKNFKAYLTVLMHVGIYTLCGFPLFLIAANRDLNKNYHNDRSVRLGCALFL